MSTSTILSKIFEPVTHFQWWKDWFVILLGCTILATGFVLFINPYNLVPGGVYGLSIVVHNFFPSWQVGTISYAFEIPLEILMFILIGMKMSSRTVVAALVTPFIMNLISLAVYPDAASLQALDSSKILGGRLDLSEHLLLTTLLLAELLPGLTGACNLLAQLPLLLGHAPLVDFVGNGARKTLGELARGEVPLVVLVVVHAVLVNALANLRTQLFI